jgi:hypothetical protein
LQLYRRLKQDFPHSPGDPPSACWVLGLQVCASAPSSDICSTS